MPTQSLNNAKAGCEGATFENLLQDYFTCGLITVDPAGSILALNPEAGRLLHRDAAQTPEPLPDKLLAIIQEALQTGQTLPNRKLIFRPPDHQPVTLSVTAMPVSGKQGPGVVILLNDVSVTAKLEHNLRRLDRLARVGTLSAGLAHEIKNALVSVKTFVELLLEKNPDADLSETVLREIARMEGLVTHMLKYAAPPHPVLAPIRLHALLDRSLHMLQPRLTAKLITLKRDFHADDDLLLGDDHQLEQALLNLLLNAVDALGEAGTLNLGTELMDTEAGRQICLRVTDTGAGIAPEILPKIFDTFFTTKLRGTGLGLAVTRRIIEEHSGCISAQSQPGHGTTFTILLPAGAPPAAP